MDSYFQGWLISVGLWVIFIIGFIISYKRDNYELTYFFNILQIAALVPMWVFLILGWGE